MLADEYVAYRRAQAAPDDYDCDPDLVEWPEPSQEALKEDALRYEAAQAAVAQALEDFKNQKWYWTAYANIRFALFWATYWIRLKLAMAFVGVYCRLTGKDSAHVSPKVWYKLGI